MRNDDFDVVSEFNENCRHCKDFWAPFISDAQVYTLAASGYTWSQKERQLLAKEGREPLEFNIIRQPLQFFSGYLRDNLNSIVVTPVEGSDQKTADQFTELQYYIWDKGGGYNTFLDACDEGFKSGISLCGIQMDYSRDFINGEISFFKRTYNSFYLDPTFEKIDLTDCAYGITRDLLNRNLAKQLLPFIDPEVIDDIGGSFRDDKFLSYHPNFTNLSRNRNLLSYDQYYRRISKTRKFLVDEQAGFFRDITDLSAEEHDKLKIGLNRLRRLHDESDELGIEKRDIPPLIDIREVDRDFVELNIMLNGQHVYCGEDKTGINTTFPFAPVLCYMEPSIWMPSQRIQGIAASLYSAQRQFNTRHMKIIDMMDSNISTGYKYLIGSVEDPEDLLQSGQGKIIGVDPENAPEGLNSVQELHGGGSNPALVEYQAILDNLTLKLANVNESVLGVDDKGNTQISGRLSEVRIAQGLRGNRKIFDNVEVSQQIIAGLVLQTLQNYPPEKIKRILGEEPTEQFYDKDFEQYDAVLKEGVRSKSQKDAFYYEMVHLKEKGLVDIPQKAFVDELPTAGASKLKEIIEAQEQQQQQAAQQQQQLQMEMIKADIDEKKALANERNTRSDANEGLRVERASEAVQNNAQAVLDRARAITEISKMRGDHILSVLGFLNQLDADAQANLQEINQEVEQRSDEEDPDTKSATKELESVSAAMTMEQTEQQP